MFFEKDNEKFEVKYKIVEKRKFYNSIVNV